MNIFISIATTGTRNEWLVNRALQSIYNQKYIDTEKIYIFIVYDKVQQYESLQFEDFKNIIKISIEKLRNQKFIQQNHFKTTILKNIKTSNNSGTGSWNTAIDYIGKNFDIEDSFFAILDDDDEYKENYLSECRKQAVSQDNKKVAGVFARIEWIIESGNVIHELTLEKLKQKEFFIGNPGIQGSNIFVAYEIIKEIGGFDEKLPSCTDRDFMIRFLDYVFQLNNNYTLRVIEEPLVVYHAHDQNRITTDLLKKKDGLDIFYKKYRTRFSEEDFKKSLERAKKYFQYEYTC